MSKSNDIVETQQINKQSSKYSSTNESARELGNNFALSTSLKMCTFEKIFHQNFTRPTMNSFSSSILSRQGGRERERWIDRQTDREREREARGRAACQAAVAHSAPLSRDVLSVPEHWRTPGIVLLPEIQRLRASRYRSHLHPSSFQPPAAVSPPVCVCVCVHSRNRTPRG